MNVCLVTRGDLLPANHGAAVKIVRTAEYLSLQGAKVVAVSDDRDRYLAWVDGRVEERRYSPRARAAQEWPGLRQGARFAEQLCARIGYPSEEHFLYTPQFDPAWWGRVLWVGRREEIDVFQAEFPGYGVPCWLAARILGRRSAIVQHNVEWDRLQDVCGLSDDEVRRIRACELFALERVDEVIAVSEDDRVRMVDAGVAPERITVIPHGVDTRTYEQARGREIRFAHGIDPDTPLLFFHGTLHYWPNTQAVRFLAEELLPRLLAERPDLRVIVAGLNPPTYYSHPAITFTGPVVDLAGHIAAADVCLCPVFSGGGTRMKLLEYFAAGKATVSATKGAEGICYTPGVELAVADTADDFARETLRLVEDLDARQAMGDAARAFASWYDWTQVTRRYLELYEGQDVRGSDYNVEVGEARQRDERPGPALALPVLDFEGIERHLPVREPSKPLTMLLLVNRGCNLRCSFCDLWDDPQNMPWEQLVGLLDEAVAIGTQTLVVTGGEPFMHPRLWDLVKEAKRRGLGVNITTNGTLIEKRWAEVTTSGVDSLSVSIDGLKATHEALRGIKGCFTRTERGLRRLGAAGGVGLSVYFTVTRHNVRELVQVYELARSIGASFDFWPVNDAEDLYLTRPEDVQAYRDAVAYIGEREPAVAARRHYYERGLDYHRGELGAVRCLGLVDQFGVTFEGDLLPCCVWGGDGLKVGNVFETPLSQLWASPEVQRFREGMYGTGCEAGCFNHSLYEFTASVGESFEASAP